MRRLSRLERSFDVIRSRPSNSLSSPFLCCACRSHAPFSSSTQQLARSGSVSTTEKWRKRIWGTNEPPGLEDPYGGPSFAEQRRAAREPQQPASKPVEEVIESEPEAGTVLDQSYEPAATWDGLDEVGGEPIEEFYFEGFMPAEKVSDPHEAVAALHRSVVEVFTLKQAGQPLLQLSKAGTGGDQTSGVQILISKSQPSVPVLKYSEGQSQELILQSIRSTEADLGVEHLAEETVLPSQQSATPDSAHMEEETTDLDSPDYEAQVNSWDPVWLQVSLEEPQIKFTVVKRVMQLTGIRIPDSSLKSLHSVKSLLNHLTTPEKPTKLADALARKPQLLNLPNVKIFDRRITPIDKEISVGRWKLIETELRNRGLPVTGY